MFLPVHGGRQSGGAFKSAGQVLQTAESSLFCYVSRLEVGLAEKASGFFRAKPGDVACDAFAKFPAESNR